MGILVLHLLRPLASVLTFMNGQYFTIGQSPFTNRYVIFIIDITLVGIGKPLLLL